MTPKWKELAKTAADVAAGLLLACLGALAASSAHRHIWPMALITANIAGILTVSRAMLSRSQRKLIDAATNLIEAQQAELDLVNPDKMLGLAQVNARLTDVALSAVALMVTIEHGMTPNLHALKRDLAAAGDLRAKDRANGAVKP